MEPFALRAHELACSLAFAVKDMPECAMRRLAVQRLQQYVETHDAHCRDDSASFLLDWAGVDRPGELKS